MNKWKPIIKLSVIMLVFVTSAYYVVPFLGSMIVKDTKKRKNVALNGPVDFLKKRGPGHAQYDEFVAAAEKMELPRDPFVLEKVEVVEVEEVPQEGPLLLQGIMWEDNAHPKAMINGEVIEIGSFIDHFMVVDIQRDHVTLIDNDQTVPVKDRTVQLQLSNP